MRELLKIMLALALIFASTFILLKATGLLTLDEIKLTLQQAKQSNATYLATLVILLLFADLFIAIPTMSVAILAGYFLGWPMAIMATCIGFFLAGIVGYAISFRYGWHLLRRIYKDETKLSGMHETFSTYGPVVLIICRAMPILPEVSCCMAGLTRMSFYRFISMYALGTIPYALITTYAGSISTLEKPMPAIATAIGVSLLLWTAWFFLSKQQRRA